MSDNYPFPSPWEPRPQQRQAAVGSTAGDAAITWIKSNKWICWSAFWLVWLHFSPETIIPGAIAFMVGYVFYRERAVTLPSICAAYLGFWLYICLGHIGYGWPDGVKIWMAWGAIFSLVILGKRYPMCGWFLLVLIATAFNRGRGGYYGRRRRW